MNKTTKPMTFGIMLALVLWGVYLAVGATGMFVQDSMLDVRKSVIVVVCVALFLGLWGIVLYGVKSKGTGSKGAGSVNVQDAGSEKTGEVSKTPTAATWSKPGLAATALGAVGAILWLAAIASWKNISLDGTTILGWLAAICIMGSATFGIIALSDRFRRRGKWLGLLGLLGFAGSLIAFVARMSP
jgi:hypothetical protein